MPVIIDNKALIPGPLATISKEVRRSDDGTAREINYTISLKGKLSAYKGSPNSAGQFWTNSGYPPDENIAGDSRLASIIAKQGAIMNLLCNENRMLEITPYDGSAPLKAIVKLRGVNFEEGLWYETCDYTLQFDVVKMWYKGVEVCSGGTATTTPPEENWSIEQADDRGKTYRVQHTCSSKAKDSFNENAELVKKGWEIARDIVLNNNPTFLGLDTNIFSAPTALNLSALEGYNYTRGVQIDEAGGRYSVTESWLMYDSAATGGIPALEEYNINIRTSEDGKTRVSIEGNITGLEVRDNASFALISNRWDNALARWGQLEPSLTTIVQANAGVTINTSPLSKSIGKNILNGTITFSREYDNRPVVVAGAISSTVQLTNTNPTDVFASLVVLGKFNGPVLQDIGTVTAKRRNLSIEVVMPSKVMGYTPSKPDVESIVSVNSPGGFKERDEESWSEETGRYSRQVAWVWV